MMRNFETEPVSGRRGQREAGVERRWEKCAFRRNFYMDLGAGKGTEVGAQVHE